MKLNHFKVSQLILAFAMVAVAITGCSKTAAVVESNYDASKFMLSAEPEGALDVIEARLKFKDAEEVAIVGRIGGSVNPWVDGRAAFDIVDPSLLACSDEKEDGESCSCKTPWDYCCETPKLPAAMALVKFVEGDGSIVKHDAREIFSIKELQTVVIKGTAKRDDAGNLTVLARGMFVRK